MAKGDGSITEIKRNGRSCNPKRWRVCISYGAYELNENGVMVKVRKKAQRNVTGSKADARQVRDQMRKELESGLKMEADKLTFREFATRWHAMRAEGSDLSERTLSEEKALVERVSAIIGDTRLKDITPDAIESLYLAIKRDGEERGRPISGARLKKYHITLKQIFKKAVAHDLLLRNPLDRVDSPKAKPPERRSLTQDEGARLVRCINEAETRFYGEYAEKEARQTERGNLFGRCCIRQMHELSQIIAVRIGLATGMRLGEVLGLPWGNVDLEARTITVSQSLTQTGHIKCTKSGRPRTIAIDRMTAEHLGRWKDRQRIELMKLRITQGKETPVCCSDTGCWLQTNNFGRWWRAFRKSCGFDTLRFHELRHTQATQLLANGVDVKTVQERLGHASASITLDWYAHALPENDQRAADLVGELFATAPEKPKIIGMKRA